MPKDFYQEYLEKHTLEEMLRGDKVDETITDGKEKPSTKLITPPDTQLIAPTLSPIENKLYGILFSDATLMLKYYDLDSKKLCFLAEKSEAISTILATDDEVYLGTTFPASVTALFGASVQQYQYVLCGMHYWQGKLLIYGNMGIIDAQKNLDLIPLARFPKKFERVCSLHTDGGGNLLAFLCFYNDSFFRDKRYSVELKQISGSEGDYHFDERAILKWPPVYSLEMLIKVEIVPPREPITVEGEKPSFSRLHYGNSIYYSDPGVLYLDGEPVGLRDRIRYLKLSRCTKTEVEIVYPVSNGNIHQLLTAKIDNKVVLDRKVVMERLLHPVTVLELVTHYPLHQKLMERGHFHEYGPVI